MGLISRIKGILGIGRPKPVAPISKAGFGIGIKKAPSQAGPTLHRGGVGAKGSNVGQAFVPTRRAEKVSPHTTQTNAAFSDREMSEFLLGHRVSCRSSWVNAAQWNEDAAVLTLNLGETKPKDYDFPNIDEDGAEEFATSYSKGAWYHEVWLGRYGDIVRLEPSHLPNRAHRVIE